LSAEHEEEGGVMTDLYDLSANPKDAIDRQKLREALSWAAHDEDFIGYQYCIIQEAASAWLAAADGMPEEFNNEPMTCEENGHNTLLSTMKKLLRIK